MRFDGAGEPRESSLAHVVTYVFVDDETVLYFDTLDGAPNPRELRWDQVQRVQRENTKYVTEAKCMAVP